MKEEKKTKQSGHKQQKDKSYCVDVLEENSQNNTGIISSGSGVTVVAAAALMTQIKSWTTLTIHLQV